jgi:hypothetical protein
MHPAWREVRDELCATATRIFAYLGGLAVIGLAFLLIVAPLVTPPEEDSTDEQPFRSDWITVGRPFRAFALTMPEFAEPTPDYAIQRHANGGGRRDIMSWGASPDEGARSRLMIEIYRPGAELGDFGAASEVAIRTATLGGPYPMQAAPALDSKFGPFDSFDFVASPEGAPRQCLGFMRAFEEPRLAILGWHCRAGLEIIDRGVIACALERLSLVMARSEPKVTELFAKAERQRKPCGQKTSVLARLSNTLSHDWLASPAMPKLRGQLAAK